MNMTTTQEQHIRADFEAWARRACYEVVLLYSGQYSNNITEQVWQSWQAARALPEGVEPVARVKFTKRNAPDVEWIANEVRNGTGLYTAAQVLAMGRVPPGWQAVPVELLKRVEDALGSFIGECDWSQSDMDAWDDLCAHIAAPRPPVAQEDAA